MTTWAEVLQDGTIGGKESLCVAPGFAPLHPLLPLAGGLVGVLLTIIHIPLLPMVHTREEFLLGGSGALEFVGHDLARGGGPAFEQRAEELLGRLLIPAALHQDIQYVPLLIYCPPQIVMFALDRQKYFVHLPLVTRTGAAAAQLIRIRLATRKERWRHAKKD